MSKVVIVGTGGHAQVAWATWQSVRTAPGSSSMEVIGWLEHPGYQGPERLLDLPVFLETEANLLALAKQGVRSFYFGIGMVKASPERWTVFERLQASGLRPETLIHPTAIVDPSAIIEPGCFIGVRAVIQPFSRLGAAAIVNTSAIVEHHARIGHNVHLAPGTILCGETRVGAHSLVGAGTVVRQRVSLGSQVTVGAGSVVLQSIGDSITAAGNPARPISQSVPIAQESLVP